jgi:hypothetical protein
MIGGCDRFKLADYQVYWSRLTPDGVRAVYRRWLFAYASVNQGWSQNVALFRAWDSLPFGATPLEFENAARQVRAGLYDHAKRAAAFARLFWDRPNDFMADHDESLCTVRERVLSLRARLGLLGLGRAKISFALELLRPVSREVVCIDRHVARWFGVETRGDHAINLSDALYTRIEDAWLRLCEKHQRPSPLVRHLLWDSLVQKQPDTRYWSFCLENER